MAIESEELDMHSTLQEKDNDWLSGGKGPPTADHSLVNPPLLSSLQGQEAPPEAKGKQHMSKLQVGAHMAQNAILSECQCLAMALACKDTSKKKKSGLPTTQAAGTQPGPHEGHQGLHKGAHAGVHAGFSQPGPSCSTRPKA